MTRNSGDFTVVTLEGDLDIAKKAEMLQQMRAARRAPVLIVDLSRVVYIESSPLMVFATYMKELQAEERELRLVVPRAAPIYRIFEIAGLTKICKIYEDVEQAKRGLT